MVWQTGLNVHHIMKQEDLNFISLSECIVSYLGHIRAKLYTFLCVHMSVCGLWLLPYPAPWTHSATLTGDLAFLLNDKSAKQESMCLQLYKHFEHFGQIFALWCEFPFWITEDYGSWINECEAQSQVSCWCFNSPQLGDVLTLSCSVGGELGQRRLQRKLIGSQCIWSPSGIASLEINSV